MQENLLLVKIQRDSQQSASQQKPEPTVHHQQSIFLSRVCAVAQYAVLEAKAKSMGEAHFRTPPLRNPSTNFDVMSNILLRPPQRVDVQNLIGID